MTTNTKSQTSTSMAEASRFTDRLLRLLQVLARGRGRLQLYARSLYGFGQEELHIAPNPEFLPGPLLRTLEESMEIRAALASKEGNSPQDLVTFAVAWRPATRFDASTNWKHAVDVAAQEEIRAALAAFPHAPAFVVNAGPEVVAFWPLSSPLPVDREQGPVLARLEALARRLGGDLNAAQSLVTTYPVCGVIRNWSNNPPERIEILEVASGATYSFEQFQEALANAAVASGGKEAT